MRGEGERGKTVGGHARKEAHTHTHTQTSKSAVIVQDIKHGCELTEDEAAVPPVPQFGQEPVQEHHLVGRRYDVLRDLRDGERGGE